MGFKRKLIGASAVIYGLYSLYERKIEKFNAGWQHAKTMCHNLKDHKQRNICLHKKMAAYYKQLAKLEFQQAKDLKKAGASPKRVKIHLKRAKFYAKMASVIANPNIPVAQARQIAKEHSGVIL